MYHSRIQQWINPVERTVWGLRGCCGEPLRFSDVHRNRPLPIILPRTRSFVVVRMLQRGGVDLGFWFLHGWDFGLLRSCSPICSLVVHLELAETRPGLWCYSGGSGDGHWVSHWSAVTGLCSLIFFVIVNAVFGAAARLGSVGCIFWDAYTVGTTPSDW